MKRNRKYTSGIKKFSDTLGLDKQMQICIFFCGSLLTRKNDNENEFLVLFSGVWQGALIYAFVV